MARQFIKDHLGERLTFKALVTKQNKGQTALARHVYCNDEYVADHIWLQQAKKTLLIEEETECTFSAVCYTYGSGNCYGLKQIKELTKCL